MSPRRPSRTDDQAVKNRSSAVRKLEEKEAAQDKARGKTGREVPSVGRSIQESQTGNA